MENNTFVETQLSVKFVQIHPNAIVSIKTKDNIYIYGLGYGRGQDGGKSPW